MTIARWGRIAALATIAAALSIPARAAESCAIFTWSGVAFGTYNVLNPAPVDTTGLLILTCNDEARNVTVDLSRGNAPTFNPRFLRNGTSQLNYNLFMDAAMTTIWGNGTAGTSQFSQVDPAGIVLLRIYGRIPALQDLPAGSYTDTIVATVNF